MFDEKPKLSSLVQKLSKKDLNMLLLAEGTAFDIHQLINYCQKEQIRIAGGIFPKLIVGNRAITEGLIHKTFPSTEGGILIEKIDDIGPINLPDFSEQVKTGIVFMDGLMAHIPRLLEELYEKYWSSINLVGGGAGSLSLRQTPCVFTEQGIRANAAVIIPTSWKLSSGVAHGWQKLAGPFVANRTEGNQIIQLNWRPAYELYRETVSATSKVNFDEQDFFEISKGFPFGIHKSGEEVVVRDPIDHHESGVLTCVGPVPENTSLYILEGQRSQLINSACKAAKEAVFSTGAGIRECLTLDCISRNLYLEDDFEKELETVLKILEDRKPAHVEGALTLGEISSGDSGFLELYNKTIVVSTFS